MFAKHLTAESLLAETLALLVVIFAFEPSRRKINNFVSYKIFKLEYSTENLLAGMEKVLYTVGDMKVFLEKCLRIVLESVGINSGTVYFIKTGEHKTYFPVHQSLKENDWPATNAYPENAEKFLGRKPAPLLKGEIERRIPSPENAALIKEMSEINAEMAIPLLSDGRLFGILCFGEKASGKFYTPQDEEVFERLAHYLSLKVQNFLFYEQLEKVRIYQENLLENLPIGVIGTDASGVVTVVNKEAERITGLYRVNVESRHFKETLPEELRNILAYSIEKKKDLRHLRFKMKKDGVEISLDANSSVFSDRDGSLAGVQVIFSDVTHVKELEEGIQRAERFASLGIMAAGIAHEIKNPLVSIQTFANLLPEKFDDKEFRETFAVLTIKEVERINSLVEQILVFAKPRSSVFEDVDVAEVVKTTVMLMSTQFPNKKIKVTENYCTDKIVLKGDEGKLRQAFLNLFINSVQAVGSEGVINVDAGKNESSVKVTIRDNGCGIKRDVMDKIFEPFFTTKEKGTGLGLAIVARIVDEHKGVLKVESVEGKGTTVSMELPLHNEGDSENELYSFDNGK